MQNPKIYGIIGDPLGHSLSPALHADTFARLGHAGVFATWPMGKEKVGLFMQSMRLLGIAGACVTIPHKQEVLAHVDYISPLAKSVGAVNTLYWEGQELCGENTDVTGFLWPLQQRKVPHRAMVLGAGGAARAVIVALKTLRAQGMGKIFVSSHNDAKAQLLSEEFQCVFVPWQERTSIKAPWLINTTPLGMQGGEFFEQSPYSSKAFLQNVSKDALAYDIVYNPLETRFLREAAAAGWQTQDGLDMFVGQALAQQKLWLGQQGEYAPLRALLQEKLQSR